MAHGGPYASKLALGNSGYSAPFKFSFRLQWGHKTLREITSPINSIEVLRYGRNNNVNLYGE